MRGRVGPFLVILATLGGCSAAARAPEPNRVVRGVARQYSWEFSHPGGPKSSELHLRAGEVTELRLESADVVHAIFIPGLKVKADVLPGRETVLVVTAPHAGTLKLACAEYCGAGWSGHTSSVIVSER